MEQGKEKKEQEPPGELRPRVFPAGEKEPVASKMFPRNTSPTVCIRYFQGEVGVAEEDGPAKKKCGFEREREEKKIATLKIMVDEFMVEMATVMSAPPPA